MINIDFHALAKFFKICKSKKCKNSNWQYGEHQRFVKYIQFTKYENTKKLRGYYERLNKKDI